MPEADTFSFYGTVDTSTPANSAGGEAFPFCVEKVDVSGFDYWTTLGGFNKDSGGSPTQEQIGNSWINACKLYWNLYGFTVTYSGTDLGSSNTVNINATNHLVDPFGNSSSTNPSPKFRRCQYVEFDPSDVSEIGPPYEWYGINLQYIGAGAFLPEAYFYSYFYDLTSQPHSTPVRMYNGPTNNEDNFVGYGIKSGTFGPFFDSQGFYAGLDDARVGAMSYINGPASAEAIGYANLSGIPFVGVVQIDVGTPSTSDAENLTANYLSGSQIVTLDSLEFYTY